MKTSACELGLTQFRLNRPINRKEAGNGRCSVKAPKMVVYQAITGKQLNVSSKLKEIVCKEVKCGMTRSHHIKNTSKGEIILKVPNVNSGLKKYNMDEKMTRGAQ